MTPNRDAPPREPGHYWVKRYENVGWWPAYWSDGCWEYGRDYFDDGEMIEIGPQILPPEETTP